MRERLTEPEDSGGEAGEEKLMYDSLQTLSNLRRLEPARARALDSALSREQFVAKSNLRGLPQCGGCTTVLSLA